jgi:hypothetical protein
VAERTYLQRYLDGEYEPVWDELVGLGERVGAEPVYLDALAVARETMRRVRHNVERLIPRLQGLGYVFGHSWAVAQGSLTGAEAAEMDRDEPPLEPPAADVAEQITELQRRAGRLPLSVRTFYEVVGGVNFVGAHPVWGSDQLDPLEVLSARAVLRLDDWNEWSADRQEDGACELPISPDEYFKYLQSGGGPYAIPLWGMVADGLLRYEWHRTTFVNYLRVSLRWAGLPGLERMVHTAGGTPVNVPALTQGLLPI